MKIFLTGATGFLGNELLKKLISRKHEITALVRNPEKARFPATVTTVQGAVEQIDTYKKHLSGLDAVVHIAALVKMWRPDPAEFDRVNVQATENLIEASSDAGISRFIYASSFMALGPSNGRPLNEDDPRRSDKLHNDYERTKYLADQMARNYQKKGYPIFILYPGIIYGPGNMTDGNIVAKNLIPFLNGKMPFGLPIKSWSYVFIQDVVQGFMQVIEGHPQSNRYILGGDNHSGETFYKTVQQVTGKKPPVMNIPFPIAKLAGFGEFALAKLFGRDPSLLTHEVVEIYKHSWAYDSTRAQKELGYKITPLREGLIEMIGWMKNEGYIR